MYELRTTQLRTSEGRASEVTLSPRARRELLHSLAAHYERTRGPVPPRTGNVPEEVRRLHSDWRTFDRFVADRLEWALSGEAVRVEETEPDAGIDFGDELFRLATSDPLTARAYLDAFEFLEGAFAILQGFVQNIVPKPVE